MMELFKPIAWLFGYVLRFINDTIGFNNYLLTIFWFTLLIRLLTFPFSLKNQKSMMDRARLAPKLERLQKKYARDQQKLQQKTQELYQKENISMTGGCGPMLVSMIVLMGVLADIYMPLQYLQGMDAGAVTAAVESVTIEDDQYNKLSNEEKELYISKANSSEKSYYREMYLLQVKDKGGNEQKIEKALVKYYSDQKVKDPAAEAKKTLDGMEEIRGQLSYGENFNMLEQPWKNTLMPNALWIIAILSGLSALGSSLLSMHYSKKSQPQADGAQKQAQGCTNGMMFGMPLFSLIITFGVPGAVGIYWIISNLLALVQTVVLNKIYDPAKAREQAQKEYDERRARKAEDKRRLAEARKAENQAYQKAESDARRDAAAKAEAAKKKKSGQKPEIVVEAEKPTLNGEPIDREQE